MKRIALFLFVLLSVPTFSQESEFEVYQNGLIYSESTMSKLSHIVDSLNLKFKNCELDKEFRSKYQTVGHFIELEDGDIKGASRDIKEGISFDEFLIKYPDTRVERNLLIVRFEYVNYHEEEVVKYYEIEFEDGYGMNIEDESQRPATYLHNNWVSRYYEGNSYVDEYVRAFYFPNEFESKPLKEKYSRMIGYADCLIDTTATKFKKTARSGWVDMPQNWKDLSMKRKKKLLDEMRNTEVVGTCSQDNSPRIHAMNIALLSAETTNWEVFLRSHLDIMNDRFDRMSDGSYAWARRNTYIRELEDLNINVPDLIFGITVRVENPANNHYYGSVGRIGRALSESQYKDEMRDLILEMVEDADLDDYNRVMAYFLFLNYNHHLEDELIKRQNIEQLKNSVSYLPEYIRSRISFEQE